MLIIVGFCMFHSLLRVSGDAHISIKTTLSGSLGFVWFGLNYYMGIIIAVVLAITRWATKMLKVNPLVGQGAAFALAMYLFFIIAREWFGSVTLLFSTWNYNPDWDHVAPWKNMLAQLVYLSWYSIEAAVFAPVVVLTMDEILELPSARRVRMDSQRAEI